MRVYSKNRILIYIKTGDGNLIFFKFVISFQVGKPHVSGTLLCCDICFVFVVFFEYLNEKIISRGENLISSPRFAKY